MPSNIDLATKSYLTLLKHDPESLSLIPDVVQSAIDMKKEELNSYRASQLQKLARSKFKRYTVRRDGREQTTNILRKNIYDYFRRRGERSMKITNVPEIEASALFRDYYVQLFLVNILHSDGYIKVGKFKEESKIKLIINNLSPTIIDIFLEKISEEICDLTYNKKRKLLIDYYVKNECIDKYNRILTDLYQLLKKYFENKNIKHTNWRHKIKFLIDNLERQLLLRIWNKGLEYKDYYPEYIHEDIGSIYETPDYAHIRSRVYSNIAGKKNTRKIRNRCK